MLTWIFWHARSPDVSEEDYRARLVAFHRRIAEAAPEGYLGSRVLRHDALPWLVSETEVYEDWYYLRSAGALDTLDEAAVGEHASDAHASVSRVAAKAVAGLYRLRAGAARIEVAFTTWISKPRQESYDAFFERIQPAAAVWSRKMVLGPAPEFCVEIDDAKGSPARGTDGLLLAPAFVHAETVGGSA